MLDVNKLADAVVAGSKAYVDKALHSIVERLSILEKRTPEVGAKGDPGEVGHPGADGTGVADALLDLDGNLVLTLSSGETKRLGVVIGKDGSPGRDGVDGLAGEDGAPGLNGVDGKDGSPGERGLPGSDGKDGVNGADGVDGKDIDPKIVRGIIEEQVALFPRAKDGIDGAPGRDGLDGKDGLNGIDGERGIPGERGLDGKDGVGLAGATINRDGSLVLTTSDGRSHELGSVVGKDGRDGRDGVDGLEGKSGSDGLDGKPGRDGVDGLGFDDLDLIYDGAKGFTFKWSRGDKVVERHFTVPVVTYRGTFKSGEEYTPGDMVTWGGSVWHCDEPTAAKPDSVDQKSWTLAVKRGQNGKDGSDGQRGMDGKTGAPGRDLTQMGPDGSKW